MGNCLKTQLKESVTNNSLVKLGNFRFKVTKDASGILSNYLSLLNIDSTVTKLTVVGGYNYIGFATDDITHNYLEINSNELKTVYFANENYEVEVSNKYTFERVIGGSMYTSSIIGGNIDDFGFNLEYFYINGKNWAGNIKNLANIQKFRINNTNIEGDIEIFRGKAITGSNDKDIFISNSPKVYGDISALNNADCISLNLENSGITGEIQSYIPANVGISILNVAGTGIDGELETFLTNLATRKSSGNLNVNAAGSSVTYNGSIPTTELIFTFNGSSWQPA